MRLALTFLISCGIALSSAALHEHYRLDQSPCSINDRWDCGAVNHSPYADIRGIPVAAIGALGYLLLGILVWIGSLRLLLVAVGVALGFSLELTAIEASVLQVWCIYCVGSLAVISLITLLTLIWSFTEYSISRKPGKAKARAASETE